MSTTSENLETTRTVTRVTGMTCASCENRIERAVRKLPGVADAHASSTHGRVEVEWVDEPRPQAIAAAVATAGYRVGRPGWLSHDRAVWRTAFLSVVVVTLIAVVAQLAGWSKLSGGIGDLEAGGLVVVLLLGLAAGVSTCMALTGGLVLAVSAANAARMQRLNPTATPTLLQRLRPVLVFNAGRVVGFTALGAVLGLVGASVTIPTQVLALMMLAVAVVMLVLGIRLTDVSPRISGWTFTLPSSWGRRMGLDEKATRGYSDVRTALLGAATFFLPCGFTQAAQVFALSTGSPGYAALIMGTFALGTTPGLLALGGLPELLPTRGRVGMLRGLGVLVLLFALVNGAAGLRLAGIDPLHPFGAGTAAATVASANVEVTPTVQTIHMQQVTDGYVPARSVVYSGIPIQWVIDSVDPQSCAVFLRVPAAGVAVTLKRGPNTIELPAQEPGTIPFSCSMGMYGGSIVVVEQPATVPAPAAAPR